MNDAEKLSYSVLYANAQRISFANSKSAAIGERAWKKIYKLDFDEIVSAPVAVLSRGDTIGIQVNPYFLLYQNDQFKKWHHSFATSADIGLFLDDKYTFFPVNGPIEGYFDYEGTRQDIDMPIVGLKDWCYPLLLIPYGKGLISAVQFSGGPSRLPLEFDISYDIPGENLGVWFYGEKGVISNALLTSAIDKLVFTFQDKIHILDPATGKKIKVFDPELPSMSKASLDLSNNIVIHALNKDQREVYTSYDLNGTKLWEHEIESSVQNGQPPVCGEGGTVYYIGDSSLICIKDGKKVWKSELFPCINPLMTNSKGNTIIVQSGFHIMAYDSNGKQKFKTLITKNMGEEFTAPPVIGGDGRIYTASGNALYCFK